MVLPIPFEAEVGCVWVLVLCSCMCRDRAGWNEDWIGWSRRTPWLCPRFTRREIEEMDRWIGALDAQAGYVFGASFALTHLVGWSRWALLLCSFGAALICILQVRVQVQVQALF